MSLSTVIDPQSNPFPQDNIVIAGDVRALICDFGCARTGIASYSMTTSSLNTRGTCNYWAPELLKPQADVLKAHTQHTDIWAFGMTIYVSQIHFV